MKRFTLDESIKILPLVKSIANELVERRKSRIDKNDFDHNLGIKYATQELESLGLSILRQKPLTIHFPGRTRIGDVVFCWQEGEDSICHGHAMGEERDARRPLKVKVVK